VRFHIAFPCDLFSYIFIVRFHKLLQLRVTFPLCLLYLPCSVSIYNVITSHLRRTVVVVELTKKISLEQIL